MKLSVRVFRSMRDDVSRTVIAKTKKIKKIILSSIAIIGISVFSLAAKKDKSTLKEKIERTEKVHVFFSYGSIVHEPTVNPNGKGCVKFDDKTALTDFYKNQEENIFSLLNEGFETTDKFVKRRYRNVR